MNIMTDQQRAQVTDAALMELLTETGQWDCSVGADGMSMESFLERCLNRELVPDGNGNLVSLNSMMSDGTFDLKTACEMYSRSAGDNSSVKILCSAYLQDENFRSITIMDVDQSNGAVVTRNDATNTYTVAYCGTRNGYGEWSDNAEGLLDESSQAQRNAALYFDVMSSRFEEGANVVVTGHSKGGNKAQYVTMFAQNRGMIDQCVSLDGQGFSEEAMAAMQAHRDYDVQRDKITLVCGSDDYVHVLGERLAREDQTYYLQGGHRMSSEGGAAFLQDHQVQYMFVNSDGRFTCELNAPAEQGELSRLVEMVYQCTDTLDDATFAYVARTAMGFMEGKVSSDDVIRMVGYLGPLVEDVLYHTPEGKAFLQTLPAELLSNEQMQGALGTGRLIMLWLVSLNADSAALKLLQASLAVFGQKFVTLDQMVQEVLFVVSTAVKGADLLENFAYVNFGIGSGGYQQTGESIAGGYDNMSVDTDVMWDCASRLTTLAEQTENLSTRLQTAFDGKRGDEHALSIVLGGIEDTLTRDYSDLRSARASLAKAVEGMQVVAGALCSMCKTLEAAEKTAAKYGGMEVG